MVGDGPLGCLRSWREWAANSWQELSASCSPRSVGARPAAANNSPGQGADQRAGNKTGATGFEGFEGGERPLKCLL
jgi:hypothetical protein